MEREREKCEKAWKKSERQKGEMAWIEKKTRWKGERERNVRLHGGREKK